jgi:CheY-like chemotaxis protein
MDGCELASRIKQRAGCENVILAALSGFEEQNHQRVVNVGFDYRFVKPIRPEELRRFMLQISNKSC